MSNIFERRNIESDDSWMSASDMMSGLMLIFLFIAIAFINSIGQFVQDTDEKICNDLKSEFEKDKFNWGAQICENSDGVVIKFDDSLGFEAGSSDLKEEFKLILDDFFPRLMMVLERNQDKVKELRIEGHTSSETKEEDTLIGKYIWNANLSQDRSKEVLEYVSTIEAIKSNNLYVNWFTENITAHGKSSSEKIDQLEIDEASKSLNRRVEFRVETTALDEIIKEITNLGDE